MSDRSDSTHVGPASPWTRGEYQWLAAILLLAAALRVWAAAVSPAIVRDGERYLLQARQFTQKPFDAVVRGGELPVYPALGAAVYRLLRPFSDAADPFVLAAAGRTVSVLAGVWLVFIVHLLGREAFDRRAGLLAAAFAAMMDQFVLYSGEVISDPTFMAVHFTAAWLILWAWRRPSAMRFAIAGLSCSLSYLTRREGVLVLAAGMLTLLAARDRPLRRRLANAGSMLAGFALLSGPYMALIGGFSAAHDDNLPNFWGGTALLADISIRVERFGAFAAAFLEQWNRCLRGILAVAFVVGWLLPGRRRAARLPALVMGSLTAGHMLAMAVFRQLHPVTSIRYVMPVVVITLPWSAEGFLQAVHWLVARWRRRYPLPEQHLQRHFGRFVGWGVALSAAIFLPYVYRGNQGDASWVIQAAEWIRRQTPPDARLLVTDSRVGFYAERQARWLEQSGPYDPPFPTADELLRLAREEGYGYLVGDLAGMSAKRDGRRPIDIVAGEPAIRRIAPPEEQIAGAARRGANTFLVYRLVP